MVGLIKRNSKNSFRKSVGSLTACWVLEFQSKPWKEKCASNVGQHFVVQVSVLVFISTGRQGTHWFPYQLETPRPQTSDHSANSTLSTKPRIIKLMQTVLLQQDFLYIMLHIANNTSWHFGLQFFSCRWASNSAGHIKPRNMQLSRSISMWLL